MAYLLELRSPPLADFLVSPLSEVYKLEEELVDVREWIHNVSETQASAIEGQSSPETISQIIRQGQVRRSDLTPIGPHLTILTRRQKI